VLRADYLHSRRRARDSKICDGPEPDSKSHTENILSPTLSRRRKDELTLLSGSKSLAAFWRPTENIW